MDVQERIRLALETEELRTVSDSFGGVKLPGRAPRFLISTIADAAREAFATAPRHPASQAYENLRENLPLDVVNYALKAAIRFSFLIELTNLSITSTKLRTRWLPGEIIRTLPNSFTNVRGTFEPGHDPRAATFDECFEIFLRVLHELGEPHAANHLKAVSQLAIGRHRSVSCEFVFTYEDNTLSPVHSAENVRLVDLTDLTWLIEARPFFQRILPKHSCDKIDVKSFLSDRTQTGTDQTNRAKRWEILSNDFQHASIEECWSVQRKLLESLLGFAHFPGDELSKLINEGLAQPHETAALCPITLERLDFNDFQTASRHGHSAYQVGHLSPLKTGGRHTGSNVAWITDSGNRIQGDNDIADVQQLLREICERMIAHGIV